MCGDSSSVRPRGDGRGSVQVHGKVMAIFPDGFLCLLTPPPIRTSTDESFSYFTAVSPIRADIHFSV